MESSTCEERAPLLVSTESSEALAIPVARRESTGKSIHKMGATASSWPQRMKPFEAVPYRGQKAPKAMRKLKILPDVDSALDQDGSAPLEGSFALRSDAIADETETGNLSRLTAYCIAQSFALDHASRFLQTRPGVKHKSVQLIDDCIFFELNIQASANSENSKQTIGRTSSNNIAFPKRSSSRPRSGSSRADPPQSRRDEEEENARTSSDSMNMAEIFVFSYGTVVTWNMSVLQERFLLSDLSNFAEGLFPLESVEIEEFSFYYSQTERPQIRDDCFTLHDPKKNKTRLAISHALSQSVKTSSFEAIVSATINATMPLPALIAEKGSVGLSRRQLNRQIGQLFKLKMNVHLQGSILDSPELIWSEPQLETTYVAAREYLELEQRTSLLTERLEVIGDLLTVLREEGHKSHDELLEWIVIVLIAVEILVAAANILVDLYAGAN